MVTPPTVQSSQLLTWFYSLVLTCPLVLKVVFYMVGLQAVHVRPSLRRAVVKVVVNHVVDHVAAQSSDKQTLPDDLWESVLKDGVETSNH